MNAQNSSGIPRRQLGKTGLQVSALGMGGFHVGSNRDDGDAVKMVQQALDSGINFFDNAWEYHEGRSEELVGKALQGRRDQAIVMTKVCTHGRGKDVAMKMLEESLRRLRTDHLDIWQVHEVIYENDPDLIFAPGGAIEALDQAKKQGKVRFVGFTGHKDPDIHLKMLAHGYAFDTVQMPVNVCDATYERSFERLVLPELVKRGIGVLGMKSMGGSGEMVKSGAVTAAEALQYAMSVSGVSVTISGMESKEVLQQNLAVAQGFQPLSATAMDKLRTHAHPWAADARFELFKSTLKYDGDLGRQQHHFPPAAELPV